VLKNSSPHPHTRADDEGFEIDATNLDALIGWNHRIAAEGTLGRVVEAAQPVAAQQIWRSIDRPSSDRLSSLRVQQ
jgi:hypothetical protein